ncbi:hypothetical protein [Lysobacter auxotrophicus]|uniref:Uncharacterized protein n=1 Tax=Lysobacter auxotrophicus TaxID=2992573 RepID=A0ABN6UH44_9GAMM|nr:hypothetical protein [Lysobacter auxotrophicus]BDU14908.1 hypothetical protein LA521A_01090 [Lysobacter auxotrophicus]
MATGFLGALCGLFVGCVLGWRVYACLGLIVANIEAGQALGMGMFVASLALVIGAIPALTYGAVAYAFLLYFRRASYVAVMIVGALPGFVFAIADQVSYEMLIFGPLIAISTHFVVKHALRKREQAPNDMPAVPASRRE